MSQDETFDDALLRRLLELADALAGGEVPSGGVVSIASSPLRALLILPDGRVDVTQGEAFPEGAADLVGAFVVRALNRQSEERRRELREALAEDPAVAFITIDPNPDALLVSATLVIQDQPHHLGKLVGRMPGG